MPIPLRQTTIGQELLIGPFLDDTDGKTPKTALTIANTDIKLFKNGATAEANKNSGGATHIASGRYYIVLDAVDTGTMGPMEINVHVAGALPVRRECVVLQGNVYDALVVASIGLPVNAVFFAGQAVTASAGVTLPSEVASAANLQAVRDRLSTLVTKTGAVVDDALNSATTFETDLTETADDHYKDCLLKFTSGALAGQSGKKITGYDGTTKFITVSPGFTAEPTVADTFEVIDD